MTVTNATTPAPTPGPGDRAPEWSLPGDGDRTVSSNREGRPLVLFLYPKDDTSGCTKEAVAFSQLVPEFDAIGVDVVGLSPDGAKSHDRFVARHSLAVPLASDGDKAVIGALGAWVEKSMYGRKYMGVDRSTFLIDGEGTIHSGVAQGEGARPRRGGAGGRARARLRLTQPRPSGPARMARLAGLNRVRRISWMSGTGSDAR